MPTRIAIVIAVLLLVPVVAQAHDTWILATPSGTGSRTAIRIDMTSGMAFPALESAIRPERVTRAMFRAGGESVALPAPLARRASLRYSLPLTKPGIAVFWVQLAPRALDLKPELIDEYLHEIGAMDSVGPRWRVRPDPKRWHEVYRKHAKTFVRVGVPAAGDSSWRDPVGMELELVPEGDPTALTAGAALPLVLLKNGQPLAGMPVAAERGSKADRKRSLATTDAAGRVSFDLDRPGPWLFAATELRENGADWESDFTTLTVAVAPGASLAPAPPPAHAEEAALLAVVDRFMHAVTTNDLALMKQVQVAEGMTFVERPVEGVRRIVARPNSYWVDPARATADKLRERYWNPTVLVRGQIAVVWTPYEFWRNGKTSHCGIDTFDLVKIDGQWRVANSMWTVEPDACPELRPADPSTIRPRD